MSLPRAIAPFCSDSPGADLAGQSEQSDERRLKTNAPFKDSTVVTIGELRSTNAGHGSTLPSLRVVEHFWWTGLPHSEVSSRLVHIPSEVRGYRTAVADVKPPLRRTPRIGAMAGRFWWSRPPHSEISSLLLHVLSEVRGCRRVVADVNRPQGRTPCIGTGVAVFLHKRPGPSIPSTSPAPSIQGKADSSRKTIRPHAWVRASIKTPPFIPTKGSRPTAHTLNPSPTIE